MNQAKKFPFTRTMKMMLITVAVTAVAVSSIFFLAGHTSQKNTNPQLTNTVVKERILRINELSTVKYMYTNVGKFSQSNNFYGYTIPFTKKSFLITYDGTIKAGVDLNNAKVNVTDQSILLTLPAAKILSHEINENSIKVYDETKNIFNPISVKDYTNFSAEEKTKMESKAIHEGLLKEAAEKAKTNLTELLQGTVGSRKLVIYDRPDSSSTSST